MKLHRVKHTLKRLSPEEKVAGFGALLVLIGAFMPWYSVVFNYDKDPVIENGFTGDLGVIGFVVFLLSLFALVNLVSEHLHIKLPTFGYSKEQIVMLLMGENAFLILLLVGVYMKRSFDFTNAELRFGIYTALIGALVGTFAAYAQMQRQEQLAVQEFFDHEEKDNDPAPVVMDDEEDVEEMSFRQKMEQEEAQRKVEEYTYEEAEQTELTDFVDEEDDMMEEVAITEVEVDTIELGLDESNDQGDFFKREAGIQKEEETPKDKGIDAIGSNFYDDEQ